jgi:hypothetical protein
MPSRYDAEEDAARPPNVTSPPSGSCPCTRPPTTSLPFLVISSLLALTATSAPKRSRRGAKRPVSRPDISRWATRRACARQRDNAGQVTAPLQPSFVLRQFRMRYRALKRLGRLGSGLEGMIGRQGWSRLTITYPVASPPPPRCTNASLIGTGLGRPMLGNTALPISQHQYKGRCRLRDLGHGQGCSGGAVCHRRGP